MDGQHFDALTRGLGTHDSRRRLLGVLAALPVVGGLAAILDAGDAEGHGRRKRRKKRHKHGKRRRRKGNKGKGKNKTCRSQSVGETCAGQCGTVTNNCGEQVSCGSCACEPKCPSCQVCDEATGSCVADPAREGDTCGPAQTCENGTATPQGACNATGACVPGTPTACEPYHCSGNVCAESCADDTQCGSGYYCNGGNQCVEVLPNSQSCSRDGECASGHCANGFCCDEACDGTCEACDITGSIGTCSTVADGTSCGGSGVCCSGACEACCTSAQCSNPEPVCVAHVCQACSVKNPCPAGEACDGGLCKKTCTVSADCGETEICDSGMCQGCDVCASGCDFATIQAAVDASSAGDTVRICAGTYTTASGSIVSVSHDLTLAGAGKGANGTIIQGNGVPRTAALVQASVNMVLEMRDLTITGGNNTTSYGLGHGGGGVYLYGALATLDRVEITGNDAAEYGGGIYTLNNQLTLNAGTTITYNTAGDEGGGIFSEIAWITFGNGVTIENNSPDQCAGNVDCP
jgi:hypothetical protein